MKQSEDSFYNSTLAKVMALLEIHSDLKFGKNKDNSVITTNNVDDFL
ncbi:hypothetical protein [Peptoanaerobacter stomatis]|nr:hypothetical protein [Peptoanaerobacter stomatis]